MPTVLETLSKKLQERARHNPALQAAPVCILWPDKERLWEPALPALKAAMPELLVLGAYVPTDRQGPALWLRAVLDGAMATTNPAAAGSIPVVYVPGWSRSDLRAISTCPEELRFLAEFQYRGVMFAHPNGRDWTPVGFASAAESRTGLGLDVAGDNATRDALQNALPEFLDMDLADLKHHRIDASLLNELIVGSPERDILDWLECYPERPPRWTDARLKAFYGVCASDYGWNPATAGPHAAALLLLKAEKQWADVWRRYAELKQRYPRVYELLFAQKAQADLFADRSHFPAENAAAEAALRDALLALPQADAAKARATLLALVSEHAQRRRWIWAELGKSDLALALQPLEELATLADGGGASDLDGIKAAYVDRYWRVDAAALEALACTRTKSDHEAVSHALRAVYLPWLQGHAARVQELGAASLPEAVLERANPYAAGACWFFVDGLRYDVARTLALRLQKRGCFADLDARWGALPSITSIGKYLCSPAITEPKGRAVDGDPVIVTSDGQDLDSQRHRVLLEAAGIQFLGPNEVGTPGGSAWTEEGDVDTRGHDAGSKLARELPAMIERIADRVDELLEAGWQRVVIVTDHGWLLMPGGLPKAGMPASFTMSKWGRSGVLAPAAPSIAGSYIWPLDRSVRMLSAPDARSFIEGREYSHGGMSVQECLVPTLVVSGKARSSSAIEIASIKWTRLRCEIEVAPRQAGFRADIRTAAAKASTSVVANVKEFRDGRVSLAVTEDELEGHAAFVVILDAGGTIVAQETTEIGK